MQKYFGAVKVLLAVNITFMNHLNLAISKSISTKSWLNIFYSISREPWFLQYKIWSGSNLTGDTTYSITCFTLEVDFLRFTLCLLGGKTGRYISEEILKLQFTWFTSFPQNCNNPNQSTILNYNYLEYQINPYLPISTIKNHYQSQKRILIVLQHQPLLSTSDASNSLQNAF